MYIARNETLESIRANLQSTPTDEPPRLHTGRARGAHWDEFVYRIEDSPGIPREEVEIALDLACEANQSSDLVDIDATVGNSGWVNDQAGFVRGHLETLDGVVHRAIRGGIVSADTLDDVKLIAQFGGELLVTSALLKWKYGAMREGDPALFVHPGQIVQWRTEYPDIPIAVFRGALQACRTRMARVTDILDVLRRDKVTAARNVGSIAAGLLRDV